MYQLKPQKLGAQVIGVNLQDDIPDCVIDEIKCDIIKHKLLLFRDQDELSEDRQIIVSRWFGEIDVRGYDQHPKSPSPLILRVSNDEVEGFRDFGTHGFHIDGSFLRKPNKHALYHMISMPKYSSTTFVDLSEVLDGLSDPMRSLWDRLSLVKTYKYIRGQTDTPGYVVHPLTYPHPETGKQTMCIHQGKTSSFVLDRNTDIARHTDKKETAEILAQIQNQLDRENKALHYIHQWRAGDLLISDNLAVAHLAMPDTQISREQIGLRVMNRTVIKGVHEPRRPEEPRQSS